MDFDLLRDKLKAAEIALRPPLPVEELRKFEQRAGVKLPADYAEFLTTIANGGMTPCRMLPLEKWDECYDCRNRQPEFCLPQACILTPELEHLGEHWLDELGVENWEERHDRGDWDPHFGTIAVIETGCGWYISLIVNGPHSGRVFAYDGWTIHPPKFVKECSFTEMLEAYVDMILSGRNVHCLNGKL